jgi:hypothetical protein
MFLNNAIHATFLFMLVNEKNILFVFALGAGFSFLDLSDDQFI